MTTLRSLAAMALIAAFAVLYLRTAGSRGTPKNPASKQPAAVRGERASADPLADPPLRTNPVARTAAALPIEPLPPAPPAAAPPPIDEHEAQDRPPPEPLHSEEDRRLYAASVFESETYDGSWAADARRDLGAKLSPISKPGVKVGAVDCRSTLCRFELNGPRAESNDFIRDAIRARIGAGMAVRGDDSSDEKTNLVIYVAREGAQLPEVGRR